MAGIQASSPESIAALVAALGKRVEAPGLAIALVAEAAARQHDVSLVGSGLRLIDKHLDQAASGAVGGMLVDKISDAAGSAPVSELLGPLYEHLLAAAQRKASGAHFTPLHLARGLVSAVVEGWDLPAPPGSAGPPEILDPSCGGAAFLLAGAELLVDQWSLTRPAAVGKLHGVDTDPVAVAVAEAALALWCVEAGNDAAPLHQLRSADGLLDRLPDVDLVVGNPPFLNQLENETVRSAEHRAVLRTRYADKVGPYGDTAALFLLAGAEALRPHGRMVLIQPQSILGSRDTSELRRLLTNTLRLHGLWFCQEAVFSASVRVCAPIFEQPGESVSAPSVRSGPASIRRWTRPDVEPAPAYPIGELEVTDTWGPLIADLVGIPPVRLAAATAIGDVARVTAGFRDQFYGFADHTSECEGDPGPQSPAAITVGMIDPLRLRWGGGAFKYAGTTWERPVVDLAAVHKDNPTLGNWADERLRPKVVLATQTRVLEAVVDRDGVCLPITPVISIEPNPRLEADQERDELSVWFDSLAVDEQVWLLAAALMAPPVTAWACAHRLGTALSTNAVKLAAADVSSIPLPSDVALWLTGAQHAQEAQGAATSDAWRSSLVALGSAMTAAYGLSNHDPVFAWWQERLPDWR